jgi:hypothetical protein
MTGSFEKPASLPMNWRTTATSISGGRAPNELLIREALQLSGGRCLADTRRRRDLAHRLLEQVRLRQDCEQEALVSRLPGWRHDIQHEQRWNAPGNVRVDLVPAPPEALDKRQLIWPRTKDVMNLGGMRLA